MRRTFLTLSLAMCVLGSAGSGQAAVKLPKIILADAAGDANGINEQDQIALAPQFGTNGNGRQLPQQLSPNLDILGVGFSTEFVGSGKKRKPSIMNIRLSLAGSPTGDNVPRVYKIYFNTPRCDVNMVEWEFVPSLPPPVPENTPPVPQVGTVFVVTHNLRYEPGGVCKIDPFNDRGADLPLSVVSGNNLIFRVPVNVMFHTFKSTAGSKITGIRAEAHVRPRGAYPYPVADVAWDKTKSYVVGK